MARRKSLLDAVDAGDAVAPLRQPTPPPVATAPLKQPVKPKMMTAPLRRPVDERSKYAKK
jgi:hypothetical protein